MKIIDILLNNKMSKTIISIILLFIIYFSLKTVIHKILFFQKKRANIDIKKINTLSILFTNLLKYVFIVIGILIILNAVGFKISSILAGLGIFSAVLALSLQDALKDFFSGVFILLENQFSVGDVVEINDFKGEVIFLGFKTTSIRNYTGEVKIISNRNITEVINYCKDNMVCLVDFGVSYEENLDNVSDVLTKLCIKLSKSIVGIAGDVKLSGIVKLDDNAIIYRISAEAKYEDIYRVKSQIYKEVKTELDNNGIKIPYPQLEVHHGK